MLVDDAIVVIENIARHFALRGKATREIVLEAVAEIRELFVESLRAKAKHGAWVGGQL